MLLAAILCLTVISLIFIFLKPNKKVHGKKIPGPGLIEGFRIFIGGSMRNSLHLDLPKVAKKYGPIMQINLLVRTAIFVNDAETFRRLTVEPEYTKLTNSRPPSFVAKYHNPDGIIFSNMETNNIYKRKLFHHLLKFYGEGKGAFEELMNHTLAELSNSLKQKTDVQLSTEIRSYVLYIISVLLIGGVSSYAKDHKDKLKNFVKSLDNLFLFENETYLQTFPFLRHIPGLRFKKMNDEAERSKAEIFQYYLEPARSGKTIGDCFKTGIVHDLLAHNTEDNKMQLSEIEIRCMISDIAIGAYLTTGSSTTSLFLQLIKRPEMQEKIYEEIQHVIGDSKPNLSHKQKMPYTEAVLYENLRYTTLTPFLAPHKIDDNFVFDGYIFPKNAFLLMNAFYYNHRSDVWQDPWEFKPERYLDDDGNLLDANHPIRSNTAIFGYGPRRCPGEVFGRFRLFMIVVTLVKQFRFLPPQDGTDLPSSDPRDWETCAALACDPFRCTVVARSP